MTTFERSTLGSLALLGSGGQGDVYHAPRARMNYAPAVAFKEYKPAERAKVDFGALEAMAAFLGARTFEEGSWLVGHVAWPAFVVTDGGNPVGFLMAEVPDDFRTTIRRPSGATERTLAQVQLLLNPSKYLAKRGIGLSDRHRYRLLAEVAETLGVLHGHGVAVGDLSPKNVLFALAPETRCFFVDADAMTLAGRSALAQAETPDWEVRAVSGEELATPASDAYKFGLLALRLLAGDQSTREPARLPASVPPDVRSLVRDAIAPNPGTRPLPATWVVSLRAAAATASVALPVLAAQPAPVALALAPPRQIPAPSSLTSGSTSALSPAPPRRRWHWVFAAMVVSAIGGSVLMNGTPPGLTPITTPGSVAAGQTPPSASILDPGPSATPQAPFNPATAQSSVDEAIDAWYLSGFNGTINAIEKMVVWNDGNDVGVCLIFTGTATQPHAVQLVGLVPSATAGWATPAVSSAMGFGPDQWDACIANAGGLPLIALAP